MRMGPVCPAPRLFPVPSPGRRRTAGPIEASDRARRAESGRSVVDPQSRGGSGASSEAVLALWEDRSRRHSGWVQRFPHDSAVFAMVRSGAGGNDPPRTPFLVPDARRGLRRPPPRGWESAHALRRPPRTPRRPPPRGIRLGYVTASRIVQVGLARIELVWIVPGRASRSASTSLNLRDRHLTREIVT